MTTIRNLLFLLLGLSLLLLPLTAQATIVDDGTECPQAPTGSLYHDWQYASGQEPNCQHGWIETWRCANCGKTYTAEYGGTGDHVFGDYQTVNPTCTQEGGTVRVCSLCGYREELWEIAPLGHDYQLDQKDPTCTQDGYSRMVCSRCGDVIRESVLPAFGHDPIEKTGYPATCTENGLTDGSICGVCGIVLDTQQSLPALGHDWGEWITLTDATCTDEGLQVRNCARCGQQETQTIPATGHKWWNWREEYPGTCAEKGLKVRNCGNCGIEEYAYSGYGDHDWGEWETVKAPTATEAGIEMRVCKIDASHVEEREIPPTGGAEPAQPEADPSGSPDGTLPEEKAELTVTVIAKDGNSPYAEKTEFKSGEKYWFHSFIENTGNVDVELYDCDKSVGGEIVSPGYSIGSRYLLHPGEKVDNWDGYYLAGMTGWISETSVASGTETETLAGTLTFAVKVYGYKPCTDDVLCTGEGSATIGLLKGSGLHPSISFESYAGTDAGAGKRYEGAVVVFADAITNTGDCPVYIPGISQWNYSDRIHDLNAPNGEAGGKMLLNPGEQLSFLYDYIVDYWDTENGYIDHQSGCSYDWYDENNELNNDWEASNEQIVDLTYPEGEGPVSPKPELTLTVAQNEAEKEAYTYTDEHLDGNYITNNVTVVNTGNVPLNFQLIFYRDDTGYASHTGFVTNTILAPGESWNRPAFWYYIMIKYMTPDPEDSPYAGTATCHFEVEGYDIETGETVCVGGPVSFTHKIAKPGPSEWVIPEESAMTAEIKVSAGYESIDPAGYQLGEKYGTHLITHNTGAVAIPAGTIHVYDPCDGWTDTYYSHDFQPGETITGAAACWNWGTVTAEDVARGYIFFPPVEFSWEDPDSGETKNATSNALTLPVISRSGLLVEKSVGNAPKNGQYFTAGETIQWKLTVTNTSAEPIRNITVADAGVTVGEFAEILPGETKECTVPSHKVTEYDEIVGFVSNQAAAAGTDLKDAPHTYNSNTATVPTSLKGAEEHPLPPTDGGKTGDPGESGGKAGGDGEGTPETPSTPGTPGGGEDPSGPIYGVKVSSSIYKTTNHGPANGEYYELGETVSYSIIITNTGDTALNSVAITDSLHGLSPIATIPAIAPGASADVSFFYTVSQEDMDRGYIINQASIAYTFLSGIPGTPQKSNKVYVYAGSKISNPTDDTENHEGSPSIPATGEGDFCSFTLTALGTSELHYTLHACAAHTEAAKNAEAASDAEAAAIWRDEIDKLYQDLYEVAQAEAQVTVMNGRAIFWAFADAYVAMNPGNDQAIVDMLRLHCAELCCMKNTAPNALPDSLLGDYATLMSGGQNDACERIFSAMDGSNCEVSVLLNRDLARTLEQALATVRSASRVNAGKAFAQTQQQWQMTLDSTVNIIYKAADKDARKTIAVWRKLLDQVVASRRALLEALYPNNPETVQEALANVYRDAAIDANILK